MRKTVTCIDIDDMTYKVPVSELKWRPSAYGIVIHNNAILLSPQFGDKYDLPGGGLDLGELPEEAVIREIREETGLEVKEPKLVGVANSFFIFTHDDGSSVQSLMFYFICTLKKEGKLSTDGFDAQEKEYAKMAEWLPLSKLDQIKLANSFDFREFIKTAALQK